MHQQSRHPPRVSSPASSPQTNPTRTNNPREAATTTRGRAGSGAQGQGQGQDGSAVSDGGSSAGYGVGPSRESIKKLDQIVQNFYYKAAVLILESRLKLSPAGAGGGNSRRGAEGSKKTNKWFQIETDDIDDFKDELRVYKTSGSFENQPPPMIIETYIDASRLSTSQSLVVVDDYGKRWDVLEALNNNPLSSDSSSSDGEGQSLPGGPSSHGGRRQQKRNTEVILERWRVELKCIPTDEGGEEFGPGLPTIYKRSIVFFRSLFQATRIMPCWKYSQQALAKGIHPALEVKCRVLAAEPEYTSFDPLRQPLFDGRDAVTEYMFGDLEVPVGRFYASVTYRNDCNFRVDDSESLLSSRFMGVDENFFKPSIGSAAAAHHRRDHHGRRTTTDPYGEVVGSLPSRRQGRGAQEPQQTYGSLSTFHGEGALGTSPMTALKAVRPIGSDTSSPPASAAASVTEQPDPPHSLPIRSSAARPSLRNFDGTGRRPSVSFQPFKAGSLSGSPRVHEMDVPASPGSLTRPSGLSGISHARNRSSLTAGMAASLRGGPVNTPPPEAIPVASSGSPKPTIGSRYSSSFTHRRGRASFGGQSKADDDQVSSGKQSLSSSAQPGSGLLAEAGGNASSGSFQTDDDNNISDFLKALDSRKTLPSFEPGNNAGNKKGGESSTAKRTATQLYKFHLMRESNNLLTESMSSSMHLASNRSSNSSSRQLANVPSMVGNPSTSTTGAAGAGSAAASMSATSSSPGKPLSPHTPHTPHTPAIPSRLSENSIIDYQSSVGHHRQARDRRAVLTAEEEDDDDDEEEETPVSRQGTTAIDIPLSPRLLHAGGGAPGGGGGNNNRRASSVAQPFRSSGSVGDEDPLGLQEEDTILAGQRSISLGADDRGEAPTLSTLLAFSRQNEQQVSSGGGTTAAPGGAASPTRGGNDDDLEEQMPSAAAGRGSVSDRATRGYGNTRSRYQSLTARGNSSGNASRPQPSSSNNRGSFSGQRYGGNLLLGRGIGAGGHGAGGGGGGGGGGQQAAEDGADDEPLLFAMSELERPSRRSLEEVGGLGRGIVERNRGAGAGAGGSSGGGASGSGNGSGFEPRGTSKRGWP
ncbi:autophagy-related protein 13-domain-containing protein [Apodospora peruviana]|uniref:Autophagy-related protein 13 n=1 Tax=Apodospora peruviana TaxID=516989 RepID=A0AAE0I0Q4_9PEZI|nr:autophagy-related protein 13-domain-containing protein [Apodospora peruviana]